MSNGNPRTLKQNVYETLMKNTDMNGDKPDIITIEMILDKKQVKDIEEEELDKLGFTQALKRDYFFIKTILQENPDQYFSSNRSLFNFVDKEYSEYELSLRKIGEVLVILRKEKNENLIYYDESRSRWFIK